MVLIGHPIIIGKGFIHIPRKEFPLPAVMVEVIIMIISKYLNSKKTKTEEIGSFTSQLVGALPDQLTRITNIIQNLNLQEK